MRAGNSPMSMPAFLSVLSAASICPLTFSAHVRPGSPPQINHDTLPLSFQGSSRCSAETPLFFSWREKNATICLMTSGEMLSRFLRFTARCTPLPMPCSAASEGVSPPLLEGDALPRYSRPFAAASATDCGGLKSMCLYFSGVAATFEVRVARRASRTRSLSLTSWVARDGSTRMASRARGARIPRSRPSRENSWMRAALSTGGARSTSRNRRLSSAPIP